MKLEHKKNSGSGYFQICEGSKVVVHGKGVYRQVDLYKRGKNLFAEHAKGKFVKLSNNGSTMDQRASLQFFGMKSFTIMK